MSSKKRTASAREKQFKEIESSLGVDQETVSTKPVKKAQKIKSGASPNQSNPTLHWYHMATATNIDSILAEGTLFSTEQLILKEPSLSVTERKKLITSQRAAELVLPSGVRIRDQGPMPPKALSGTLPAGVTPSDWYQLLNSYVFLWPDKERLERHRGACGGVPQKVLVLDAQKLIADFGDANLMVSPINSGFALRAAAARSPSATFVPYNSWLSSGWPADHRGKTRPRSALPVEIVIKDRLLLEKYLVKVE